MNTSRYMLIDDRYPYPVKRRVRGTKHEKGSEPAITLLPPDPYVIMEKPDFSRSSSPTMYRTAPPKSAKNKEASSFVILGETIRTPVQSRPGSPSGRVSPFRGRGFKSPTTTRPSSRVPSPSDSPKKIRPVRTNPNRPVKVLDRPRIGADIGLPPKSPMKSKLQEAEVPTSNETSEKPEAKQETAKEENVKLGNAKQENAEGENAKTPVEKADGEDGTAAPPDATESPNVTTEATEQLEPGEPEERNQELTIASTTKQRLTPATPREKKSPVSPATKKKTKAEKNEANNQQSVIKKTTKPPIPPKKIGSKATLKAEESKNDQIKTSGKEGKSSVKENGKKKEKYVAENAKNVVPGRKIAKGAKEKDSKENLKEIESVVAKEAEKPTGEESQDETKRIEGKPEESKKPEPEVQEKDGDGEKPEKVVPCFQPDKCQIAPPTMASPSPIITPTISTPSTTADLASSSTKSSQSIAAAPTTVTPSSLGSVSSTVVLTGNLARKEIESRNKSKESDAGVVRAKDPTPAEKVSGQMVKAASGDSIKWTDRDNLSGEITSTTKVIKGDPEMEVLSPNNLRDSPPRMPPPNVAWDEGRLPNGDVPNKPETVGRFRRMVNAVWRFLCYLFCCRCFDACKCRRRTNQEGASKPSIFSRFNCCSGKFCGNPFKCCSCCCKPYSMAGKCEGRKCCRWNPKPGNPKQKTRKCCAKSTCCSRGCCDGIKARCLNFRLKFNNFCRSLFCLNRMCCQNFLRKFKCCHRLKCCQKDGFCSCCNPNVKKEAKKLNKKGSRASNNSKDKDNLDVVLVEHTSLMKAAIPVLPSCLAVFCLILNLFVPGFGTFVSGILCLCFGKPRFSVKDTSKNRIGSFILNTIIGVAQLFTVIFCLVGWGWSVWWGVIMYKLSRRQKRLKLAEKNQKEAEGSNVNHNHVDVEQG